MAAAVAAIGGFDLSRLFAAYSSDVVGGPGAAGGVGGIEQIAQSARGADFGSVIGKNLNQLESLDATASTKAVQAATGDLTDVHDYVIAAQKAQTAVELTTTVRNKALEAFNEIMRMQL